MKTIGSGLLLKSFLVLLVGGYSALSYGRVWVSFSPDGGVREQILEQLSSAVNTIDVAMYGLSDHAIIAKLKEVSESGVQVRLVLEKAEKSKHSEKLEQAGIDVRYVTKTMHHKFTIIDGPQSVDTGDQKNESETAVLLTGSGNWSNSSSNIFDEDFLVIDEYPSLINQFQNEFNFLWKYSTDFPGDVSYPNSAEVIDLLNDGQVVFTSSNYSPAKRGDGWIFRKDLETESGAAAQKLIDTLAEVGEGDHLRLALNHFLKEDLYLALKGAMDRGAKIEMVLNQSESWDLLKKRHDGKFDESLSDSGANVLYKVSTLRDGRGTKLMHAKFMVLNEEKVVTGSYNWSDSSEYNTFENLIEFDLKPLAKDYINKFEDLQSYGGSDEFKSLLAEIKKKKGFGPCFFGPLSLDRKEIVKLKKAYNTKACNK